MLPTLLMIVLMHPVHETVTEVQWNPESRRYEVSMRLHILDQDWIEKRANKEPLIENWAVDYLSKKFVIRSESEPSEIAGIESSSVKKATATQKLIWVGSREEGSHVWWFFEVEPSSAKLPHRLEQRLFFERNEGFSHRVLWIGELSKTAFTLTIERPAVVLKESKEPSDEPVSLPPKLP